MEDRQPIPRSGTGLRSRRELGSFYMRRKEGGEVGARSSANLYSTTVSAPVGGDGKKFTPRRAPSFARGVGNGTGGNPNAQRNQIYDSFARLSPAERQQLVEGLEKRMANGNLANGDMQRKNLPRPRSKSLEIETQLSDSSGDLKPKEGDENPLIEDPVLVSTRSNLSDFSDAEEVESEELEGEAREVGEEVERWLNEGLTEQAEKGTSNIGSAVTTDTVLEVGACPNCEDSAKKIQAMESTMSKMQSEIVELRLKLRKKSKKWNKLGMRSSGSKKGQSHGLDADKTQLDSERIIAELSSRLEDTVMERDQYMEIAKRHIEQAVGNQ
uniref:Uncharacterized protein n=1 Tax=Rhodosorus marinus TaxID=101924 RepID=A0A7S3EJQ8_9RHOD|mmetsp:Transcript_41857/g.164107  ORF Transcript_41857/g.164107 Transcript_41857/m.164107 type:complete len:327 (+) Transcript_41857:183-1163(+)